MTLRRLKTLVAIADARTFSAAAKTVHVTHAAVSQQMQTLEADLGLTLFDRGTRTPELTPIGHQVVEKARHLIADYEGLVPSILNNSGTLGGTIRLGAIGTTLTGLAPKALAVLKARYPQLGLHIRPGLTGDLLVDLERGHLDAAIVTRPHAIPGMLICRDLITEPMELIAAKAEPLDDPIALLADRPYIRFNRNAVLGRLIDTWILSRKLPVTEAMELDSAEAIASMVAANLGVSIVPRLAVHADATPPVKRLDLGPDRPERILGLVCHRDTAMAPAIDALFEALCAAIGVAPS